jgi:hypothetical protein
MKKVKIIVGQIYINRKNNLQILIAGRKRDKWLTKVLTEKPGVYNDTHTMSNYTIFKRFTLLE